MTKTYIAKRNEWDTGSRKVLRWDAQGRPMQCSAERFEAESSFEVRVCLHEKAGVRMTKSVLTD